MPLFLLQSSKILGMLYRFHHNNTLLTIIIWFYKYKVVSLSGAQDASCPLSSKFTFLFVCLYLHRVIHLMLLRIKKWIKDYDDCSNNNQKIIIYDSLSSKIGLTAKSIKAKVKEMQSDGIIDNNKKSLYGLGFFIPSAI